MQYDIFISYRRATGKDFARIIKPELEKRHLKVFLDLDELKDGKFDKRILDAIESAPVFMIILSPGMLDRCVNEDDWVRQEILHAQQCDKHIVPVEVDKSFRSIPDFVPSIIKNIVGQHQFSQIDTEMLLQASVEKLIRERINPFLEGTSVSKTVNGAEIHVETDSTCKVYRYSQYLGEAEKGKDTVFRLHRGTQKLVFRSLKYEEVVTERIITIPDEEYTDYVKVDMVSMEKNIERKKQEEQDRIEREKERQQAEEERIRQEKERKEREEQQRKQAWQQRCSMVTIKPALWPRWLAWTMLLLFGAACGILSFTIVFGEPIAIIQTGKWWTFVLASIPLAMMGQVAWHFDGRRGFYHSNRTIEYCNDDFYMSSYDVIKYNDGTREVRLNIWVVLFCLFCAIVAVAIVSVGCYFLFGLFENEIVQFIVWLVMIFLLYVLGYEIMPLLNAIFS